MNGLSSLNNAYHIWESVSAYELAPVFPLLNLPIPSFTSVFLPDSSKDSSDGFTTSSHLNTIQASVPSLPQNALIKVIKSLLIIKSKEKKSCLYLIGILCCI